MNTISVCMIVRDEEKTLARCLDAVRAFADELVVVDTGSTDSTKKIAKAYTDKVYDFEWCDDFSKARNFSFSKATCDYIMWLDADDVILQEDIMKLWNLKLSKPSDVDVYMLKYVVSHENFVPLYSFYRERIVKRGAGFAWQDPVHEIIAPHGKIVRVDISIFHCKEKPSSGDRNLKIYQNFIANGKLLSPRQQFYYARELYFNGNYDDAIHEFSKFLTSKKGWIENNIEACLNLARCYKQKNEFDNALTSLFGSFAYDSPRAEILCEIGMLLMEKQRYKEAIYWFKLAKGLKPNLESGGFVSLDCYNFLPCLELSVCYYFLGNKRLAKAYHEKAKKIHPQNESIIYNSRFFEIK